MSEPITAKKIERIEVAEDGQVFLTDFEGQLYVLEHTSDGGMTWDSVTATKTRLSGNQSQ